MRVFWIISGFCALGCGIVGIALPLVPTVPFLLLAAFCFARGSQRLHDWLITHPQFGDPIVAWQDRGAISARAKVLATCTMAAAFGASVLLGVGTLVLMIQAVVLGGVALFIWSRPND